MDVTTDLRGACIPNIENNMSRRYLMIMQRWIPVAMEYFQEWPDRPNCGHFFGGVWWYGRETSVPMMIFALASSSPEYDEDLAGFSKEEIIETAVKAIRYLCFTHFTGPEDCLRPTKGLGRLELCGTKWGARKGSFHAESQWGKTVADITLAALILRSRLDEETWTMVTKICAAYLDRFGDIPPRSGVYADTQMEENGGTSWGLAASYLFLSRHEDAERWEENAKRWMFCTATVPQDMFNQMGFEGGVTVRELCGKTFTTLPDFMAENHGFVHSGYTGTAVTYTGLVGNIYRVYGRREPRHLYWHRREIYENLKRLSDSTGSPHPVQGMDWPYISPRCFLHASAHLYLKDPDAGYYERVALSLAERIQLGNKGRMVDPKVASRCHDIQDPLTMSEIRGGIGIMGHCYLAHRLFAREEQVEPTSPEQIARKFSGLKVYPHSCFVFHRHGKGQTSFSWRNNVMALPLTKEGILTIGPSSRTLLGRVSLREYAGSQKLVSINVREEEEGFVATLVNDLSQRSVRQHVLLASLSNGNVISVETFTALKECTVERVEQGYLQITNENFPYVEGNCNGRRRLYHPSGERTFKGFAGITPDEDIVFTIESPRWLNVDDRVGLVFRGTGRTVYYNRHHFKPPSPYRAVADDLILSLQDEPKRYRVGERIAKLTLVLYPEQNHKETKRSRFIEATSQGRMVGLMIDNYLCVGNFGEEGCHTFRVPPGEAIPIFPGTTTIRKGYVSYTLHLRAKEGAFCGAVAFVKTEGEGLRIEYTPCGNLHLTNESDEAMHIQLEIGKEKQNLNIKAGVTATADL